MFCLAFYYFEYLCLRLYVLKVFYPSRLLLVQRLHRHGYGYLLERIPQHLFLLQWSGFKR